MKPASEISKFLRRGFASSVNPIANALRFDGQNKLWTHGELNNNTRAVAYGLAELGFQPGNKILMWADKRHGSEIVAMQIAAMRYGITLCPISDVGTAEDLEKALKTTKANGLLLSPNTQVSKEQRKSEVLSEVIDSVRNNGNPFYPLDSKTQRDSCKFFIWPKTALEGTKLNEKKFPDLKHIIHTGFYTIPATSKFRQILVYTPPSLARHKLPQPTDDLVLFASQKKQLKVSDLKKQASEFVSTNKLRPEDSLLVIGNPNSPSAFALGGLLSTVYGNFVTYSSRDTGESMAEYLPFYNASHVIVDENEIVADNALCEHLSQLDSSVKITVLGSETKEKREVAGRQAVVINSNLF